MKHYEAVALSLAPKGCRRVLDFGCGDGSFCKKLTKRASEVYGCDTDRKLIGKAKKTVGNVTFSLVKPRDKTPYRNNFFDCVFMMGVLEHVDDEKGTLSEIWRILKPNGSLLVFGINKCPFGIFDAGNIKFRFPHLHKFLYSFLVSKKRYREEFVNKKQNGMFGDFSLGKKWHSHYSTKDLERLFKGKFKIQELVHFGLFVPILLPLKFVYDLKFKRTNRILEKIIRFDHQIRISNFSYLFVVRSNKISNSHI